MAWYPGLLLAVGAERLAELLLAKRNLAGSRARGGIEVGGGHYPAMVTLHLALLVGCVMEVVVMGRPRVFHCRPALARPA